MLSVMANEHGVLPLGARRLIAVGLIALTLAACGGVTDLPESDTGDGTPAGDSGGGTAPSDGSTGDPGSGSAVLDCERDGYPCSFAQVPLQIIERSLALSDEVAGQLTGGVAIEQVASMLGSQSDVVDVTVDGPVIGFRVAGGRPMIVDVTGDQEFRPSESAANVPAPGAATTQTIAKTNLAKQLRTVRTAMSSKIIGGNKTQRRALVLSPFRYEQNLGNTGELIAAALNGVRGYAGNVTYIATTNEFAPQVTVDVLTQLQDYDVIHMDTHGGTLCKNKDGPAPAKDKLKCDDGITDFLVQRFHGTAQDLQSITHPGVVHYTGAVHQSIAVTADFFRYYYPNGLGDKLFILASCNTFRTDMADAIAGNTGVFMSWDSYADFALVRNTGLSMIDSLGLGLTVSEAFERIPPFSAENEEAQGSIFKHTTRRAGGDLRIRDLLTVRDNLTGHLISDSSGIEVMELPEDGENDSLDLEFVVDGITPEQLANFRINLMIENQTIGQLSVQDNGIPVGDFSYRVTAAVPLHFDAEYGQPLHLDFWIPLPDDGEDRFLATPKVNERAQPGVGRAWRLDSETTHMHHDSSTIMNASVEFEIDADDDPDGNYHNFYVRRGTVRIRRDFEDALNCRFHIDHTIDIPAGAPNNYLVFDNGADNLVVSGFGRVPTENILVASSCGTTMTVQVGGVYLIAEDTIVSGDAALGTYDDGANLPTVIQWRLDKME